MVHIVFLLLFHRELVCDRWMYAHWEERKTFHQARVAAVSVRLCFRYVIENFVDVSCFGVRTETPMSCFAMGTWFNSPFD